MGGEANVGSFYDIISKEVSGGFSMWTVIYIATNRAQAEKLKTLLCEEGILANMRPAGVGAANGDGLYEILVLESEADEAHAILCQHAVK